MYTNFEDWLSQELRNVMKNFVWEKGILGAVVPEKSLKEKSLHTDTNSVTEKTETIHPTSSNFKILGAVVPEELLKEKFTHKQTLLWERLKLYIPYILMLGYNDPKFTKI